MNYFSRVFIAAALCVCSVYSKAQQVDFFGGVHVMGYVKGMKLMDYSKPTFGIAVKDIFNGFGIYGSIYSLRVKSYGDTTVVNALYEYRTQPFDSAKYDLNMMPFGWTSGLTYTFRFRLSIYCGAGVALHRVKHIRYDNYYNPTATGFYTNLNYSKYSETFSEEKRPIFEFGADYDFIPSEKWACGLRVGYNSSMKISVQASLGYRFNQN